MQDVSIKLRYDYRALNYDKHGYIVPYPIKELRTKHWSGISKIQKL